MRQNTIIAVVLIVLGIAAFTYQGITYKTREKAVDLGALQVTAEKTKHIPISPIVGVIALISGIVLLVKDTKKV
jgi:membrane-bound ClpP family serine protease